jgi:photosystem II stability/assembly factor-like uncharacterized protein
MMWRMRPCPKHSRSLSALFLMLSVFLGGEPGAWAAPPSVIPSHSEGLFVTHIAIDPLHPHTLYTLTTYSIGILKSTDGGANWAEINQGIRSYSLYALAVDPRNPKVVYLGAGGAGLYKSTDGGATWAEMNDGLQNTDIGALVLHPNDPEIVYVVTSTGLFKSPDGGKRWIALNQGDDFTESQQYQSLLVLPTTPPTFYLASKQGLYTRTEDDGGWVRVPGILEGKKISALARDPRTGRLYATVVPRGTLETLSEGGLFVSDDGGKHWSRVDKGLERDWIRDIVIDPTDSRTIYVTTSSRGVLKSHDGGKSWKEINIGLAKEDRDFRALVMDPNDSKHLYAGSHGEWVYQTRDAGKSWSPLPLGVHQTSQQLIDVMNRDDARARRASPVTSPPVFQKCNHCHGWTDPLINQGNGSWRVAANRRDWALTVKRMSKGAQLTPAEEATIASFLNDYTSHRVGVAQPLSGEPPATDLPEQGIAVASISVNPNDPDILYAATTFSIGILKSRDGGKSWAQINDSFKSFSFTRILVDPLQPDVLYAGDGCAGLFLSHDGGRTWRAMNDGLQNTEIGAMVVHPTVAGTLYVVTTRGAFKAEQGGQRWVPFNQGDTFTHSLDFPSLLILPTTPATLYLASGKGLYRRREGDAGWVIVPGILEDKQISALARDSRTGRLYAGVLSRGAVVETLDEGGLFVSDDEGAHWARLGQGVERDWIRSILIDPADSKTLYLGTTGRGVLKSTDGGMVWQESNRGLTDPDRDVRTVVLNPRDPSHLYAGTHGHWMFQSQDAGTTWTPLPLGPHQTADQILAALVREDARVRTTSTVHPPAAFGKCNRCHGWTDSRLNTARSIWRVPANRRDWVQAVKRMSEDARLSQDEEVQIAGFLTTYSQETHPAE